MSERLTAAEVAALEALARGDGSWMTVPDELLRRVLNEHVAAGRWVQAAFVAMLLWERSA